MLTNSSPLLTKQHVAVTSSGENVVLQIGNVPLTLHYEHALAVHRWVRQEATSIKRGTGRARTARSLGVLTDLDAKSKPLPYTPGTAIHAKPKLQDWRRENVWSQGRMIVIKIGSSTIQFHFETALKIAQWLRVRAKEARNRAGDFRHWSAIAVLEDAG